MRTTDGRNNQVPCPFCKFGATFAEQIEKGEHILMWIHDDERESKVCAVTFKPGEMRGFARRTAVALNEVEKEQPRVVEVSEIRYRSADTGAEDLSSTGGPSADFADR